MTSTRSLAAAAVLVAAAACSSGRGESRHAAPPNRAQASTAPTGGMMPCPLEVPGTQVAAADTSDGEAVTFTTTPDHAAELRSRVRAMADMHNGHHQGTGMGMGMGMGGGTGMGGGMHHDATGDAHADQGGMMMPPPSRATVEDVDGGARILVTPNDPADLERLRSTVRAHAEHMQQTRQCGHAG